MGGRLMCLLCIEIAKGTLTANDFVKNLEEIAMVNPEHISQINDALDRADPDYLNKLENDLLDKIEDQIQEFTIKL